MLFFATHTHTHSTSLLQKILFVNEKIVFLYDWLFLKGNCKILEVRIEKVRSDVIVLRVNLTCDFQFTFEQQGIRKRLQIL